MRNSRIDEEERADIVADDVVSLRLHGYEKKAGASPLWLNNVRNSFVDCIAMSPVPPHSYRVSGAKTASLCFNGSGFLNWKTELAVEKDVRQGAVHMQ